VVGSFRILLTFESIHIIKNIKYIRGVYNNFYRISVNYIFLFPSQEMHGVDLSPSAGYAKNGKKPRRVFCRFYRSSVQGKMYVDSRPEAKHNHQHPRQFAVLLNTLFAIRLTPQGRPYTLTEVAKATGMSVPYLSILRKGAIEAVPFQRVEALARFFRVKLDYFSQQQSPEEMVDLPMQEALAKPLVREVALRAGKVGTAQRALILQMLEHAEQVLQEITTRPAEGSPNTDLLPCATDSPRQETTS